MTSSSPPKWAKFLSDHIQFANHVSFIYDSTAYINNTALYILKKAEQNNCSRDLCHRIYRQRRHIFSGTNETKFLSLTFWYWSGAYLKMFPGPTGWESLRNHFEAHNLWPHKWKTIKAVQEWNITGGGHLKSHLFDDVDTKWNLPLYLLGEITFYVNKSSNSTIIWE